MISHQKVVNYAKALFDVAGTLEQVHQRENDLSEVGKLIKNHSQILTILTYPQLSTKNKIEIIEKMIGRALELSVRNLLILLIGRKCTQTIRRIAKEYHKLVSSHLKEIDVEVTTVKALTEEEKRFLLQKLEKRFHKKIQINESIDPSLIGGLTILVRNQFIDLSIRDKLKRLKKHLLKAKL